MRIGIAQLNFIVGDFDGNFDKMREASRQALAGDVDLLIFSELAAAGYTPRDLVEREDFVALNLQVLERVAALTAGNRLGIICGFAQPNEEARGKPLWNGAALCIDGTVADATHKSLLPTYDVFDESRYFEPAREAHALDFRGIRLGVSVCEDMWNDGDVWPRPVYHRDPVDELADDGARLHINISASPWHLHKTPVRLRMCAEYARSHGRYFVYANQVGGNDELIFDGRSIVVDPSGQLVARAHSFKEDLLIHDIPAESLGVEGVSSPGPTGTIREAPETDEDQTIAALVLGTRDYIRKCGFSQVVLGLSGGIDSALTAAIAAMAIGGENVLGVAMPSRYSSQHSVDDAAAMAAAIGAEYRVIEIESVFNAFSASLAPAFAGRDEDVTEENLQARTRGTLLMALSNKFGRLVLTTGNKSELAVGYCTLYGDMCGGLAVISDVPKTLVYRISRRINETAGREIIPESTLTKPPSAELRPGQLDQDSLPPYEVLDEIIRLYVKENASVADIVAHGYDRPEVEHVVKLINRNEYKRRQAAPGLKVTSRAFGIGRSYPMAARYWAIEK